MIKVDFSFDQSSKPAFWQARMYNDAPNGYSFSVKATSLSTCLALLAKEIEEPVTNTRLQRLNETSVTTFDDNQEKIKTKALEVLATQFNEFTQDITKDVADLSQRIQRLEHFLNYQRYHEEPKRERS